MSIYELSNSRYAIRFIRNKLIFVVSSFMIYGRAACAVISNITLLNPSPSTTILIAVLSGSVSVTSVEYSYGNFKYVITTSSNITTYCLLSINTPLPLVPFTVTVDLELPVTGYGVALFLSGCTRHRTEYLPGNIKLTIQPRFVLIFLSNSFVFYVV